MASDSLSASISMSKSQRVSGSCIRLMVAQVGNARLGLALGGESEFAPFDAREEREQDRQPLRGFDSSSSTSVVTSWARCAASTMGKSLGSADFLTPAAIGRPLPPSDSGGIVSERGRRSVPLSPFVCPLAPFGKLRRQQVRLLREVGAARGRDGAQAWAQVSGARNKTLMHKLRCQLAAPTAASVERKKEPLADKDL